MIRTTLQNIVSSIVPCDPTEEAQIAFVKNWIASGAELFRITKPDNPPIHLVSYFMVFDQTASTYLLVDHKKAQLWLPPGGHVEIDEHPQETVRREVQEELGIEADFLLEDPLFLTVTNTAGTIARHTDVSLWYLLKGNTSAELKFDPEEFHQIRWFNQEDIPFEKSDPHMKRFIDKATKLHQNRKR